MVPKVSFWTVVVTLVIALLGSYIYTQINFVKVEKNLEIYRISCDNRISLLEVRVSKDLEILSRLETKLDANNEKLSDLEKKIILKQDKKFENH